MLNLSVILEDSARECPDREAVVLGEQRLSYATVNALANQVANLLHARGIGPADKVALTCPNLPYFPPIYYGILKAGAVVVPLSIQLGPDEVAHHLTDSDAKAYFCFAGAPGLPTGQSGLAGFERAGHCRHLFSLPASSAPVAPEDPGPAEDFWQALAGQPATFQTVITEATDTAVILYGSGTSGRPPLGADLSHHSMTMNALVSATIFEAGEHDVVLASLPLFHSFGQTVIMNVGFVRRATLALLPKFEPLAALGIMHRERVTMFAGVPTNYWALLSDPEAAKFDQGDIVASLRYAVSGGASLPDVILRDFRDRYGVEILEGYGLSETSPVASFNRPGGASRPGSIGLPVWGVEMALLDDHWNAIAGAGPGEIAIRGHNVMKGYLGRPEETAKVLRGGWVRSGDIGRRDADGYYYVVDRVFDVILRDGVKIYPKDVEQALMFHPQVSLASVIGVPDERHGQEVKAYVIPAAGATITADELVGWARQNLPGPGFPQSVEFRDTFPMTATGKVLKHALR